MAHTAEEYRITQEGAGWVDRSDRGRIRVSGSDAAPFLQALVTNEIASLASGQGAYAAYLTPQGRMIADLTVYRRPSALVLDVEPGMAPMLASRFDQLIFSEDVRVEDVSGALAQIGVVGPGAAAAIGEALGVDAAALAALPALAQIDLADGFVARLDLPHVAAFDLVIPATERAATVAALELAGARAVSHDVFTVLAVEAGRPRFGIDMTEETIPLEVGLLERAISTSKGCYVGQEVIIRVLHRGGGRVARRLVTLSLEPADRVPPAGSVLLAGEHETGRITSAVISPARGAIALGYVHRDAATEGAVLQVSGASQTARITGFAS